MTSQISGRRTSRPVRFSLSSSLCGGLDGAWWPYTPSMARELSDLTDVLRDPLGQVIDISVNWSPLQGVADLDVINRGVVAAMPGRDPRRLRIMAITGSEARAHLLVVPCRTSIALAVMLLRQAADLPVLYAHQNTPAFHTAGTIVQTARTQISPSAAPADSST